ncbi:MAG: ABC transporter permease [Gemmatimonadota bacterium]
MPEYERLRPRDRHEWAFRHLLRLYPHAFREEFGDAMVEFFRDRLADVRGARGPIGSVAIWGSVIMDTMLHASLARLDALRRTVARVFSPPPRAARAARREDWMLSTLRQDVRIAIRGMRRTPALSALIVTTLALGLGANSAIFSVVNAVQLRPLPFPEAERLVQVAMQDPYFNISEGEFVDIRRDSKTLSAVAAFSGASITLTGDDVDPERTESTQVSERFFKVLEVQPMMGRTFSAEEERFGGPPVAVLSHAIWQRRLGGARDVVGRTIGIDGALVTVVGVMPPSFRYPPVGSGRAADGVAGGPALWVPLRLRYDSLWGRNNHYLSVIGRTAPGRGIADVNTELNVMGRSWKAQYPDLYFPAQPVAASVRSFRDALLGDTRPFLLSLLGAVAFVLLIACVNVANLLLVRADARRKELAIRSALGASRTRLVRQALTESLIFAIVGGTLGVLVAFGAIRVLVALAPTDLPRLQDVGIDGSVLLFTSLVTIATGFVFGVAPALAGAGDDTNETLKEGGKTSTTAARGAGRTRRRLVTAEIALAVVTLSGAGLMTRSLLNLQHTPLGFDPRGVLTMSLTPPAPTPPLAVAEAAARSVQFYDLLLSRVRAIPGVQSTAASQRLPVDGYNAWSILVNGASAARVADAPLATPDIVTPGYFATLGITLVKGRLLEATDVASSPFVVVINESMAKAHWGGRDPIGGTLRVRAEGRPWATVVGVVRDVRAEGLTGEVPRMMYFPYAQSEYSAYYTPRSMSLVVRTSGDPSLITAAVRRVVHELDARTPISRVTTLDALVAQSVGARRFSTALLVGFAVLALLLAGIGIYGVVAASVSQRAYEIGVRMALGARAGDVGSMILREGMRTGVIGASLGLAGALASATLLRSMFYEVTAWDPTAMGAAVLALLVVVALASAIPAWRAIGVDPNKTLRAE